ncbi:MAG: hypothetical protein SO100_05425, partial [Dysosmobacter sp.]|nr:hypothetical protein [Dysosmobacter sp.]
MIEKGPFCRLLAKVFLTTGGFLSALSLLYAQTTIYPPESWNFREIALFPFTLLLRTLTLAEPGLRPGPGGGGLASAGGPAGGPAGGEGFRLPPGQRPGCHQKEPRRE